MLSSPTSKAIIPIRMGPLFTASPWKTPNHFSLVLKTKNSNLFALGTAIYEIMSSKD
jgi:hypothetical protein